MLSLLWPKQTLAINHRCYSYWTKSWMCPPKLSLLGDSGSPCTSGSELVGRYLFIILTLRNTQAHIFWRREKGCVFILHGPVLLMVTLRNHLHTLVLSFLIRNRKFGFFSLLVAKAQEACHFSGVFWGSNQWETNHRFNWKSHVEDSLFEKREPWGHSSSVHRNEANLETTSQKKRCNFLLFWDGF